MADTAVKADTVINIMQRKKENKKLETAQTGVCAASI